MSGGVPYCSQWAKIDVLVGEIEAPERRRVRKTGWKRWRTFRGVRPLAGDERLRSDRRVAVALAALFSK